MKQTTFQVSNSPLKCLAAPFTYCQNWLGIKRYLFNGDHLLEKEKQEERKYIYMWHIDTDSGVVMARGKGGGGRGRSEQSGDKWG